jgi:uncharacterized protein (DUF1684 family)
VTGGTAPPSTTAFPEVSEVSAFGGWCQTRARDLAAPDSWLGVVGLFWLAEGSNVVGADPAARVLLPQGPARLGDLLCHGRHVLWQPAAGAPVVLQTDAGGVPDEVSCGTLALVVIERAGKLAVRLCDRDWKSRRRFVGLNYFPFDPAWQVEADWLPLTPPQTLEVPDVTGDLKPVTVSWRAVFRIGDKDVTLLPMNVSESAVFFVFRDATSGRQSYGAGRFLHAAPAHGSRITLDFNRSINPPCAFTPFATCPLPPPENWLPFPVLAGEMSYLDH